MIDSFSSFIIIMAVPAVAGAMILLTYMLGVNRQLTLETIRTGEKRAVSLAHWIMIGVTISLLMGYLYYAFVRLDYFTQFGNALLGLIQGVLYLIISPLYFIYLVFTVNEPKTELILDSSYLMSDVRSWFVHKFALNVNQVTQATLLVLFKLMTLVLFSTKIIHITRFLMLNLLKIPYRLASIGAIVVFVLLVGMYVQTHYNEVMNITTMMQTIIQTFMNGEMR